MSILDIEDLTDILPNAQVRLMLLTAAGIFIIHILFRMYQNIMSTRRLDRKFAKRRQLAEQRKNIVRDQLSKDSVSVEITSIDIETLLGKLKTGELRAMDVLHAFQHKAFEENAHLNFMTEPIVEAEEIARELDSREDKNGLLFGLPVSLKECIDIKGYDSTAGMGIFIDAISKEDGVIVQVLKQHGAIPFVRTNLPQAMKSYDCSNPIYGSTSNPQDISRCPGGSSSGEGAILGCGASIMGVGNDLGGSVRVPAEFCGVYALKPTVGRLSGKGERVIGDGITSIFSTNGMMASDWISLVRLTQALLSPEMYKLDPSLPCLPFDVKEIQISEGRLRIGYYTFDGITKCQPSNIRAVMEAKSLLEKQGHELVPFEFPVVEDKGKVFPFSEFFLSLIFHDRGKGLLQLLGNDTIEPSLSPFKSASVFPAWAFRLLNYLFGHKDKHMSAFLQVCAGFRSITEHTNQVAEAIKWRESFMKCWLDQKLDAVICPVFCAPAVTKDVAPNITVAGTYTQLFNAVNYPAGVVPVTRVTKDDIAKAFDPKVFRPETKIEKQILESSRNAEGLSVGVQVACLPFKEELCLRVMGDIAFSLAGVEIPEQFCGRVE